MRLLHRGGRRRGALPGNRFADSVAITADAYSHLTEGGREPPSGAMSLVPRTRADASQTGGLFSSSRSSSDDEGRSPQEENAQVRWTSGGYAARDSNPEPAD